MRFLIRQLQRLLILVVGLVSIWLIVFVVFEDADRRLPWFLALAVTYGIAAYIILPYAIRMGLKILQRKSVPSFTITGDGLPGDPVNLGLIGTLHQLRAAFAAAGWSEADRLNVGSGPTRRQTQMRYISQVALRRTRHDIYTSAKKSVLPSPEPI